jgi:hypothetical protein
MNTATYDRLRRRKIADGVWLPREPSGPVADHVTALRASGMSLARIAAASGVAERTLRNLAHCRHVQGTTAAAIRAVTAQPRPARAGLVPYGTGVARRVQALVAIGWPLLTQARRLDLSVQRVWDLAQLRTPMVKVCTYRQFVALFEELSATPGPSVRARNLAVKNGWCPPLAWDDNIDDPAAEPQQGSVDAEPDLVVVERALSGERLPMTAADREAALLRGVAQGMSLSRTALTLGINYSTAQRFVARQEQLAS